MSKDDYYPFGLTFNSYQRAASTEQNFKYNGKELISDLGLGLFDYGTRFYNPELGLFHSIDLKAEIYNFQSPYVYAANNPILFIDKNGEGPAIPHVAAQLKTAGYVSLGNQKMNGSYPVIFNKGTSNVSTSNTKGSTKFNMSNATGTFGEIMTGVPSRTVTSITERTVNASAVFSEDGSSVTLTNKMTTTTTTLNSNGKITGTTENITTLTSEHSVSTDSDGNVVLGDQKSSNAESSSPTGRRLSAAVLRPSII